MAKMVSGHRPGGLCTSLVYYETYESPHQHGTRLALGVGKLLHVVGNDDNNIRNMNESVNTATPTASTPCACTAAPAPQAPAAPAPKPQQAPAASPAPAAPKAGKRNQRKR